MRNLSTQFWRFWLAPDRDKACDRAAIGDLCRDPGAGSPLPQRGWWPGHASCFQARSREARSTLSPEEAQDAGTRHGLFARRCAQLCEQILHVPLDSLFAHLHGEADFLVGKVARKELEHLALLRRKGNARGG